MPQKPSNSFQMNFPQGLAVAFDADEFDAQVRNQGTVFVHWRAMRCPVGLIDKNDLRKPHEDHSGCSNGFLYTRAGEITLLFSGNGLQVRGMDAGILDSSTVAVTIPTSYDEVQSVTCGDATRPTDMPWVAPYDRFFLREPEGGAPLTVPNWELIQAHSTGYDKLSFQAVEVTDLVDSQGKRYGSGDYEVTNTGQIHWIGSNRPGIDPLTSKGRVYAIRYTYRPYWYVKQMLHEIRLSQVDDPESGQRLVRRFAQAALLQREYVFEKNMHDPQAGNGSGGPGDASSADVARQIKGPENGSFGPR